MVLLLVDEVSRWISGDTSRGVIAYIKTGT